MDANESEPEPTDNLEIATCADHLRHTARIAQQLTAALSVHLDLIVEDFRTVSAPAIECTPDPTHIKNLENTTDTHRMEPDRDRTQPTAEEEC